MRINENVLAVLSAMECIDNEARITSGQLDRKLYLETNKVLEALGGKWNRKAKAHLFTGDAARLLDTVITAGEVTTAREVGFFETPEELASELCAMADVREGQSCLEPSAGLGRIVEAMAKYHPAMIDMVEFDATRHEKLKTQIEPWASGFYGTRFTLLHEDFLDVTAHALWSCGNVDRVVMNPPFCKVGKGDHLDHVRHAFEMLLPNGRLVSVLPVSVEFRQDRKHREFREWYEGLGGSTVRLPEDAFKPSGTGVRTLVLRMDKGE